MGESVKFNLGIFTKTFQRDSLDSILDVIVKYGFKSVQFNMASAGMESMPEDIPDKTMCNIKKSLQKYNLGICALSATFNTVHPDRKEREKGIKRFKVLASKVKMIGTDFLTLCTGTRNTKSIWEWDAENSSTQAWEDLLETMSYLVKIAEEFDIYLGIEVEQNNIVSSPQKALQLMTEMKSKRLRIIMDPANIFHFKDIPNMDNVLKEAFDLLGPYISLAHAKDITDEYPPQYRAAGTGVLNYDLYIKLLEEVGYKGPLVLHGLLEQEVLESVEYVSSFLR